jgi:hypothetical protein
MIVTGSGHVAGSQSDIVFAGGGSSNGVGNGKGRSKQLKLT